jgi:hypothetical protein
MRSTLFLRGSGLPPGASFVLDRSSAHDARARFDSVKDDVVESADDDARSDVSLEAALRSFAPTRTINGKHRAETERGCVSSGLSENAAR